MVTYSSGSGPATAGLGGVLAGGAGGGAMPTPGRQYTVGRGPQQLGFDGNGWQALAARSRANTPAGIPAAIGNSNALQRGMDQIAMNRLNNFKNSLNPGSSPGPTNQSSFQNATGGQFIGEDNSNQANNERVMATLFNLSGYYPKRGTLIGISGSQNQPKFKHAVLGSSFLQQYGLGGLDKYDVERAYRYQDSLDSPWVPDPDYVTPPSVPGLALGGPVQAGLGAMAQQGPEMMQDPQIAMMQDPQMEAPQPLSSFRNDRNQQPQQEYLTEEPMTPEQEELYAAAKEALDPASQFQPKERQAILAAFEDEFGPGSVQELALLVGQPEEQSDGMSDSINAKVSQGEYVVPASDVSAVGNGDTDSGYAKLDQMFNELRTLKTGSEALPPSIDQSQFAGNLA